MTFFLVLVQCEWCSIQVEGGISDSQKHPLLPTDWRCERGEHLCPRCFDRYIKATVKAQEAYSACIEKAKAEKQ